MRRVILFLISYSLFLILTPVPAFAQTPAFSLAASPSVLRINATAPAKVETEITIDNKSREKQNLQIRIRNFISNTSDGKIEYIPEDKLELKDILIRNRTKIFDNDHEVSSIEIAPSDSKTLKLKIDVDSSIPHGDYYFSILFISTPIKSGSNQQSNNTNSTSYISGGIGANILLSVGPKGITNGSIREFSTNLFLKGGPVQFNLLLQNSSDHYINPNSNITIQDMFGRDVGRVEIPQGYILTDSSRKSEVIWPEKFLFGLYKATAAVNLSDTGPTFKRSIIFISLPIYVVSLISLVIFILIGIYLRVKRKI